MPTSYSWSLASSSSAVAGSSFVKSVPFCRKRDPLTGELLFDAARRTWATTSSPVGETLLSALRTLKTTAARDLSHGLDGSNFENARPNARALIKNAIDDCLRRYVADGRLAEKPKVTVDTIDTGASVVVSVRIDFKDSQGRSDSIFGTPA